MQTFALENNYHVKVELKSNAVNNDKECNFQRIKRP